MASTRCSAQATYTAPEDDSLADTSDEDYAKLTPYAQNQVVAARAARKLRKLEVRSADLRNEKDCNGAVFGADLCGNQPVRRVNDDASVLARSSGEEPASPRHRAGVASMA